VGPGIFKTQFPSRIDLEWMIEWGVMHTKFKATMQIEETVLGKEVKAILPKVWVQFTGLPKELRVFLVIWAIGSILGVTKAVDMKFTNKYHVCLLKVMVLDPNLMPQFVDVATGDYLYELQFQVEDEINSDNPEPMDMDDATEEGKEDQIRPDDKSHPGNHKQINTAPDNITGSSKQGNQRSNNVGRKASINLTD
jgi:hypothetical protein